MRQQTMLGDGTKIGASALAAPVLRAAIELRRLRSPARLLVRGQSVDAWDLIEVGLLRDLCKLTVREIGSMTGRFESRSVRIWRRHRLHLASDPEYGRTVALLVGELTRAASAVRTR